MVYKRVFNIESNTMPFCSEERSKGLSGYCQPVLYFSGHSSGKGQVAANLDYNNRKDPPKQDSGAESKTIVLFMCLYCLF